MEARNRPISDWFPRIKAGQIKLPRFQRQEAWDYRKIEGVLQNVLDELPIGSVLTLEISGNEPFISRYLPGAPGEKSERVSEHLLDGQQRLTALWKSLNNLYDDREYFVSLEPNEEEQKIYSIVSHRKYMRDGVSYPLWITNDLETWKRCLIPLRILGPTAEHNEISRNWARAAGNGNSEDQIKITEIIADLRLKFSRFNIPFLSLPTTTAPATALDVFIRMNSSAQPLTSYDIVVAQAEAKTGQSLHEMLSQLKQNVPELTDYVNAEDAILAVNSLFLNKSPVKKSFHEPDFAEKLINNFVHIQRGLQKAIAIMEEERIFSDKFLPSENVFFVLAALWAMHDVRLDSEGNLRALSRKYAWRGFLTNRYEKTASTRSLVDLRVLNAAVRETREPLEEIFDSNLFRMPSTDDWLGAGWPARNERLSKSAVVLSFKRGAFDFADGSEISRRNVSQREFHHIFPRNFLGSEFPASSINRALNCAYISMPTNRAIGDSNPISYMGTRVSQSNLGEEEIRRRVVSHIIPYSDFIEGKFDNFMQKRALEIHDYVSDMGIA